MEYCIKKFLKAFFLAFLVFGLTCCNRQKAEKPQAGSVDFSSINFTDKTPLAFAEQFSIEKSGSYSLVKINGETPFLVVEAGFPVPGGVPSGYAVLQKPLSNTYLVSSSAMDFFIRLNILDCVKFTGMKKDSLYLPEAVRAMEEGRMHYAGKYSAPDYEMLYSSKTGLSVQNTMIYHKPEVKEKMEQLGIPVLVEKSSYEKNPLGKLEWIKLYGFLFDREKEADEFFNLKANEFAALKNLENEKNTEKTAAFFYFTSGGAINVRKPGDYIARCIEMAGGKYFIQSSGLEEDNAFSTMNMQAEDFYVTAKDADLLIYNSTIDGMVEDKKILLQKYPLLKDFKGFKNDRIYCTDKKFFQETTGIVDFMQDLNRILNDDESNLRYLVKVK